MPINTRPQRPGYRPRDRGQNDDIVSTQQLAERLQLNPDTIRKWAHDNVIPYLRGHGKRRMRFHWPAVLAALEVRE
jgi:excisionase family DNA binding protein